MADETPAAASQPLGTFYYQHTVKQVVASIPYYSATEPLWQSIERTRGRQTTWGSAILKCCISDSVGESIVEHNWASANYKDKKVVRYTGCNNSEGRKFDAQRKSEKQKEAKEGAINLESKFDMAGQDEFEADFAFPSFEDAFGHAPPPSVAATHPAAVHPAPAAPVVAPMAAPAAPAFAAPPAAAAASSSSSSAAAAAAPPAGFYLGSHVNIQNAAVGNNAQNSANNAVAINEPGNLSTAEWAQALSALDRNLANFQIGSTQLQPALRADRKSVV